MIVLSEREVREQFEWQPLIDKIAATFREGCSAPIRTAHAVPVPGEDDISLLMMPAWQ